MGYVKGTHTEKATERAATGQTYYNLSNKINKILDFNTKYKINIFMSILIKISDWIYKYMRKQINSLFRRISSNFCKYFPLREVKQNSVLLKYGLGVMTSFPRVQNEKEMNKNAFRVETPDKSHLDQVSRPASAVVRLDNMYL